ncbi:MAG: class II aldolase/adducin family protein [Schwartzia sp.]|nr:class II aldolase/adducin family protein [Schwartzia sp. (in: firmicutes)]MBR1885399.1 class II aldolase/adducin family protein [Schwartzia sp. (in: firmicutes)]
MLEALKTVVVRCAQTAEAEGLCRWRSGNFSALDTQTGLICVTPSGIERRTMKPEDVVVMNRSARVVEAAPGRKPSSEALMHLAAYETRPDIRAVAHTHSPFALVFAALEQPIPGLVLEAAHLCCEGGTVPVAPFAPQGTTALADSVREPLQKGDALLLARHGVMAVGASLEEALLKAAYVEELAEVAYRATALASGASVAALPPESLALHYPEKIKMK